MKRYTHFKIKISTYFTDVAQNIKSVNLLLVCVNPSFSRFFTRIKVEHILY